ncbi:MAG: hypothetical protein Tsb0013_20420 [Phycisphaerales bacterium]
MRTAHRWPLIALLGVAAVFTGCERRETLTVWETKVRYANSIVSGAAIGTAWTVTADTFDESEGVLLAVRLDDGFGKYYYAERAHIIVDPAKDTVALRLENVTGALAEDEKTANASGIYQTAELMTEPVRVPYDIRP